MPLRPRYGYHPSHRRRPAQHFGQRANGVFVNDAASLHEYVAFTNSFLQPVAEGALANQDLHKSTPVDLLIVTWPSLFPQARRLAAFHQQHDQLKTTVVTTAQVYNEFSSGSPDPAACAIL